MDIQLTDDEIAQVYSMYNVNPGDKLELKQIKHAQELDVYMICKSAWAEPLNSNKSAWRLEYKGDLIILRSVKADPVAFHINVDTGNVHVFINGKLSTLANNLYVMQYYLEHYYAFPLRIAKGRTPLQLGIAVPDKAPLMRALSELYKNDKDRIDLWIHDKTVLYKVDLNNIDIFEQEMAAVREEINYYK